VQELELTVAGRIELDFRLRPLSDVWEAGQYNSVFLPGSKTIVTFFGPDVDTTKSGSFEAQQGRRGALESTVSEVIDSGEINYIPLQGRDVYTMLVTQPGVTSDAATARGLGLSIDGQRPTASNFLLDGLENNNYLITGPLTPIAPEAIQEYRVSTNNFSAEYGRTSGYLANAITKAGGNQFHGLGYFYLKNDVLNANGFQENLAGKPRSPDKEIQPGYFVGGPVLKERLFFSSAFERLRSRSQQDPFTFLLPTPTLLSALSPVGQKLLTTYPAPPSISQPGALLGELTVAPPVAVNRSLGIERLDYTTPSGKDHLMARGIFSNMSEPDFQWSPYKDFITPLIEDTWAAGGSYVHSFRSDLTNEFRASYSVDDLHFNRPHSDVPTLLAYAPTNFAESFITLPGSLGAYSYKNLSKSTELLDNIILTRGRHLITLGAGLLLRNISGYLTFGGDGEYVFGGIDSGGFVIPGLFDLITDSPEQVNVGVQRTLYPNTLELPNFNRDYSYHQYFFFGQDTYKLTSRLVLNYGIRYENFGSPSNTGLAKDALVQLGSGSMLAEQLTSAQLVPGGRGNQQLFGTDNTDWAIRTGASYDLFGTARTVLRGGFGIFYDRPFDNLWQNLRNNDVALPTIQRPFGESLDYLAPIASVLPSLTGLPTSLTFPDLTLVDPKLKNGKAYIYFAGVQQQITNNLTAEVNGLGTYGRNLITTDIINRGFSVGDQPYNPALPSINYRSNQGFSDYNALTAVVRYRASRGILQASYTWSHYIDNQSDSLVGDFFDLSFTAIGQGPQTIGHAAFSQQFNYLADKGNSDYDQRHNLVLFGYWNLPAPFRGTKAAYLLGNWTVGGLAAFRSGFPYTVINGNSNTLVNGGVVYNPRPDIVNPSQAVLSNSIPVPGGKQSLNPAAFQTVQGTLGNEGRNAFIGPGIYNIDLSLGRTFGLPWLRESATMTLRADAFNFLNHANLNNPDPYLGDGPFFGVASFGRLGKQSGFPAVSPLNETGRQIQLLLRLQF
jgi:hypothetical protein